MADIKEKVICPWCKEEMRPYPHQGYYWFQCKCGARSPTLWHATEERARENALSYTANVAPNSEVAREIFEEIEREIKNHGICYAQRKIAKLKKKYTEAKSDE